MPHHVPKRRVLAALAAAAVAVPAAVIAAPAGAAGSQTVKCVGTADFCGATVSIAGGASNKRVTVRLTDTDFKRIGVRVIPANSKGAFSISNGKFSLGGSQYTFTLNAVQSNPKGARIILLFAAGVAG